MKPKLDGGKVAYVWVDALRFEMARELCRLLKDDFDLTLQPAIATMPTITEIGMAALLPKAHETAKVVSVGSGKLGLEIERHGHQGPQGSGRLPQGTRRGAGVRLQARRPAAQADARRCKDGIQNAQLVLVTSQEIDEFGESDTKLARLQMDSMLNDLRRGVRILSDLGIKTIILAADHGHLFAEEIGDDMKIEAPGGKTADLHRRVWVGEGGTSDAVVPANPAFVAGRRQRLRHRHPVEHSPSSRSQGGNLAYFHGGLSPQELIIPVVVADARRPRRGGTADRDRVDADARSRRS